jgi:hypothetical protein
MSYKKCTRLSGHQVNRFRSPMSYKKCTSLSGQQDQITKGLQEGHTSVWTSVQQDQITNRSPMRNKNTHMPDCLKWTGLDHQGLQDMHIVWIATRPTGSFHRGVFVCIYICICLTGHQVISGRKNEYQETHMPDGLPAGQQGQVIKEIKKCTCWLDIMSTSPMSDKKCTRLTSSASALEWGQKLGGFHFWEGWKKIHFIGFKVFLRHSLTLSFLYVTRYTVR